MNTQPIAKLHDDEVEISERIVQAMLEQQFPAWANLPFRQVGEGGSDNALFKLGHDKLLRLPRTTRAVAALERECVWLPQLAPHLPVVIPTPLARGAPTSAYELPWAVFTWLNGVNGSNQDVNKHAFALDMAAFIRALQDVQLPNAPLSDRPSLRALDAERRKNILQLQDEYDAKALAKAWDAALELPDWQGVPVWIHGDLHGGNFLVGNQRLAAVLDFGYAGVGNPARDLIVAWHCLTPETRLVLREALKVNDETWARGRAFALEKALVMLPYYRQTNAILSGIARHTINQILAEE